MSAKVDHITTVLGLVEPKRDEMLHFLRDLVRIPSIAPSEQEGQAQMVVSERFRQIEGLKVEIWEPTLEEVQRYPMHPIRLGPWSYRGRPNVVGTLRGAGGGRSILLNAHIDVVSPEPVTAWQRAPWGAQIDGNRLYGRGAVDTKAGLVAMTYAVQCIAEAGLRLKAPLILQSVVEEEAGGGGTLSAVLRGYRADAAIVAEPTGSENLCVGTCGSRFFRIRVAGQAGMPQLAHERISAIEPALKLYRHLAKLNNERAARLRGKHPLFETKLECPLSGGGQVTNLNIGVLRAGDWPATVPGWAEMEGRIGFPPSEQGDGVMTEFEHAVKTCARDDAWLTEHSPAVTWWGARREGFELPLAEPVVQTVRRSIEQILGQPSTVFGSPAATDAAYLTPRLNEYGGCPAVIYGPGGANAHGADEYVEIEELIRVTKVLVAAILDWCDFHPPD